MKRIEQTPTVIAEARNLSVSTPDGEPILRNVSISVKRGDRLLVVGPSGAGKTTLLNALIGNVQPEQVTSGSVELFGQSLYGQPTPRRHLRMLSRTPDGVLSAKDRDRMLRNHVGIYLQRPDLNDSWTVHQNLEEAAQVSDRRFGEGLDALEVARRLGIDHILEHETGQKSGGQKQRIALGALLVPKPELLVLDEPTSALSESDRHQALGALVDVCDTYGMTAIMISHDDEANGFATHTLTMRNGMVLESPQTQAS